jgi:hypothetical protein
MDTNHPSQRPSAATIEAGQEALARGGWEEARAAFERALGTSDSSAEILSGLAGALWWLGEIR